MHQANAGKGNKEKCRWWKGSWKKCLLISGGTIFLLGILSFCLFCNLLYRATFTRGGAQLLSSWMHIDLSMGSRQKLQRVEWQKWFDSQNPQQWQQSSREGLALSAFFLKASQPTQRLVILIHGYRGDPLSLTAHAQMYQRWGYHVLMPALRGHSVSGGDEISFGWHDQNDLLGWIELALQTLGREAEITLHGVSMGAATVALASGLELPPQVKRLIADCPYDSLEHILNYQLQRIFHIPLRMPIEYLVNRQLLKTQGFKIEQVSVLEAVQRSSKPILFIHGGKDNFVPPEMSRVLFEAMPKGLAWRLEIPNAPHYLCLDTDPKAYAQIVEKFLKHPFPEIY